jgi:thioredoxin reductase/NAD-dependent dihydropyrimidine dehydrogenase PreA subunit
MSSMSTAWLGLDSYSGYAALVATAMLAYLLWQLLIERRNRRTKEAANAAGLSEPPSLHPIVDPARCIGCGACTRACPEGNVLGLIAGKAELIEPASCIGHGACKTACPTGAITLVFGTATRGVEIPNVSPTFESNVRGIFIAGELGGMGLIANAIEQGRQAMEAIARLDGLGQRDRLDVVIVGSGPAGLAASLAARKQGLAFVTLEQSSFGGTVAHFPRGKIAMTRPAELPLHGKVRFRKVRKERLLGLWREVAQRHRLPLRFGERVEGIERQSDGSFLVATGKAHYSSRAVLLAIGRRGSPRRLGVPGEDLAKVVYTLVDPAQYRGQNVLVVGGGDSAIEAAAALAREPDTAVTVALRGADFLRAKPANHRRIEALCERRRVRLLPESNVLAINGDSVDLAVQGRRARLPNDAVVVCAGGLMPGAFLARLGVEVEMKYGTP